MRTVLQKSELGQSRRICMFVVTFLTLSSSKLSFEFMNSNIDARVGIFACFLNNENLVMFGAGNYFHVDIAIFAAVKNDLDPVDTVIVLRKL